MKRAITSAASRHACTFHSWKHRNQMSTSLLVICRAASGDRQSPSHSLDGGSVSRSPRTGAHSARSSLRERGAGTARQGHMTARRRQQLEAARAAALELGSHLHHRNIDALTKVARNTLENIKRRITSSNVVFYGDGEC